MNRKCFTNRLASSWILIITKISTDGGNGTNRGNGKRRTRSFSVEHQHQHDVLEWTSIPKGFEMSLVGDGSLWKFLSRVDTGTAVLSKSKLDIFWHSRLG